MAKKNKKSKTKEPVNENTATKEKDSEMNETPETGEQSKEEQQEKPGEIDWKDKYIRLVAEFDNYRKRTLKEKMEMSKTAGSDIFLNMLPIIDDFERAMQSMENIQEVKPLKDGVELIYNKFREFLKQRGVKEIEAKEKEFDTDHHEALTKIPAPSEELKGKVVDVIEKGYFLHDTVIRYSKVVVGE